MSDVLLDVSAKILTPTGWLELENAAGGYELGAESFSEASVGHRKTEITSEWIEGSFVSRAVKEEVSEKVSVYVKGTTPYDLQVKLKALTDGFDQLSFSMVVRFADNQETWDCLVSEYSISTKQEMRFATIALVNATVPRAPTVTRLQVVP